MGGAMKNEMINENFDYWAWFIWASLWGGRPWLAGIFPTVDLAIEYAEGWFSSSRLPDPSVLDLTIVEGHLLDSISKTEEPF